MEKFATNPKEAELFKTLKEFIQEKKLTEADAMLLYSQVRAFAVEAYRAEKGAANVISFTNRFPRLHF